MGKPELSNQRSDRRLPPSPKVAPWLVFPHEKVGKFQTFCDVFDEHLENNKSFRKFIPEMSKKVFWQKNSHQGWLISVSYAVQDPNFKRYFLWNPVSLETIFLPSQPDLVCGCSVKDCVLSSPPQISRTSNSEEGDVDYSSTVYILYDGGESPDVLIYCHPGEKEWRKHEFVDVGQNLWSMLCFKGKLYIMCLNRAHLEVTIQYGTERADEEILIVSDLIISIDDNSSNGLELVAGCLENSFDTYWIEAFGEIFRIYKSCISRGIFQNCVTNIVVSKLNFSSLAWEKVKSLDDYVFFLSYHTQLSCLASDLGLSKGCVYFTQRGEMSLYKYQFEDDSILLTLPCLDLPAPWYTPEWMMISATQRFNGNRRTTDRPLGKEECIHEVVIKAKENEIVDKDGENEDSEEARPWITLNNDILWSISNHLHTLDYIHLRGVGKQYRMVLNLKRSSSTRTMQTTESSPWLVFPKHQAVYNFLNPMHNNENYLINIPEVLNGSRIRFSKGGWLLLSKGRALCFYNPFTKSTIKLPNLPEPYCYAFTGISFSSSPTSSDCVVFGIRKEIEDAVEIFFIKRGDECWTHDIFDNIYLPPRRENVDFLPNFNNPVFYNGAFYCLDLNGTLGVFKVEQGISWEILAMVARPNCEFIYRSFLVEFDGKLMSIFLGHLGKWVRIFRLNEAEMVWVEVKHLGRHMLCISNTSCISAMAPTSRLENKIYFPRLHNAGILYYSLDTGAYHSFGSKHFAKDYRDSKENLHCSWIEPNWSDISDHCLDWLNN